MDGAIITGIVTGAGVGAATRAVIGRIGGAVSAQIGSKLEYLFGNATSSAHNIARSTGMLRQMQRIGIFDNPANRAY